MSVRRAPYSIHATHCTRVASLLDEWASLARAGKLRGIVAGAMDEDMQPLLAVAGVLEHRPRDAYWLAALLEQTLMIRSREQ